MAQRFEDDYMEDMFYEEAEGPTDFFEEESSYADFYEEEDEFESDEWDEAGYFEDEYSEYDDFDDEYDEFDNGGDELEETMAYAIGADDMDELFGKIWKGIKRIGRRVGRVVGKVARPLSKVAGFIPGPWGSIASTGLRLLSRLRAEGADEQEAMEAFAELAAYDEAAIPIVSGLAVKSLVKGKAKKIPKSKRKKMVKEISEATKKMVKKSGSKKAVRAVPKIIKNVKRRSEAKGTPISARPKIARKIILKVANNRKLTRKLASPSPRGRRIVKKAIGASEMY